MSIKRMGKLSFIGLGAMGSRIAKRLSTQNTALKVHLYDTNMNATNCLLEELADQSNVFGSNSLHETISNSDYVMTCLPNSSAVLETIENCFKFKHGSNYCNHPFAES